MFGISTKFQTIDNTIELLANEGKVTANRLFLRIAFPAVDARLLENPDLNLLDL